MEHTPLCAATVETGILRSFTAVALWMHAYPFDAPCTGKYASRANHGSPGHCLWSLRAILITSHYRQTPSCSILGGNPRTSLRRPSPTHPRNPGRLRFVHRARTDQPTAMKGRRDNDDLFKNMFTSFADKNKRGSSASRPPRQDLTLPPLSALRRFDTDVNSTDPHGSRQFRSMRSSYHPPPTTSADKHPRHSEPKRSGLGGFFGSFRHAGEGSGGHGTLHGVPFSNGNGKSSNSSKGSKGGSKGREDVASTLTEDAPPRKKTRVMQRPGTKAGDLLLRTQSAHGNLQSSTRGKMSKSRSSTRLHLPTTTPPIVGPSRPGPSQPPSQKKFPCGRCAAVFTQNGQLNRHIRRVHEKEKDHVCQHCGRLFGSRSDCSRHVKVRYTRFVAVVDSCFLHIDVPHMCF